MSGRLACGVGDGTLSTAVDSEAGRGKSLALNVMLQRCRASAGSLDEMPSVNVDALRGGF